MAFPVLLDFPGSRGGLLTDLANPFGGSFGEFGMITGFPCPSCRPQCLTLPIQFDFPPGQFHQEACALSVADHLVDFGDHVRGIRNHNSLTCHNLYA